MKQLRGDPGKQGDGFNNNSCSRTRENALQKSHRHACYNLLSPYREEMLERAGQCPSCPFIKTLNSWTLSFVKLHGPSPVVGRTRTHSQLKAQECQAALCSWTGLVGKSSHPPPLLVTPASCLSLSIACLPTSCNTGCSKFPPRHTIKTKKQPGINIIKE